MRGDPRRNLEYLGEYYEGATVADYERKRQGRASWQAEQQALEDFLRLIALPAGSTILDVPVGTGRFLETYSQLGFRVIGIDISADMVAAARQRGAAIGLKNAVFELGDASRLALAEKSVDVAVSVRFLNHLEIDTIRAVTAQLARASRRFLIVHARVALDQGGHSRPATALNGLRSGARRVAALAARLFRKKKIADRAATIHTAAEIHAVFTGAGLRILRDICVNRRAHLGFAARMYLLAVQPV